MPHGGRLEDRPRDAVDEGHVAENAVLELRRDHGHAAVLEGHRRVEQGPVRRERPVADGHRQVAVAGRQAERVLLVVVDEVHPEQAAPDVLGGGRHGVVVVPERRGPLLHRVGVDAASRGHPRRRVGRHTGEAPERP